MNKLRKLTFPGLFALSALIGLGSWASTHPEKIQEHLPFLSPLVAKQSTPPAIASSEPLTSDSSQGIDANKLVHKSRLMMQDYSSSFSAEILQIIQTPETSYRATGTYTQASNFRSRLEVSMEIQGIKGRLLQVSDGQVIRIVRELKNLQQIRPASHEEEFSGEELHIEHVDLKRLFDFAKSANKSLQDPRFAREFLAGIPGLLAALEAEMNFKLLKQVLIQDEPHYVLQGDWKIPVEEREYADSFSSQVFSGEVPERIHIYLRVSDLMLVRYLCLKKRPRSNNWYAPLAMELSNIVINTDVQKIAFHWQPQGDQVSKDVTHKYLDRLKNTFQVNQNEPEKQ